MCTCACTHARAHTQFKNNNETSQGWKDDSLIKYVPCKCQGLSSDLQRSCKKPGMGPVAPVLGFCESQILTDKSVQPKQWPSGSVRDSVSKNKVESTKGRLLKSTPHPHVHPCNWAHKYTNTRKHTPYKHTKMKLLSASHIQCYPLNLHMYCLLTTVIK